MAEECARSVFAHIIAGSILTNQFRIAAVLAFAASVSVLGAANAVPVDINFDNLACDVAVTNQYPEATFSSDAGFETRTACDFDLGTSLPNYICSAAIGGDITCANSTIVDFTDPVSSLTFLGTGDNDAGPTSQVDVYVNGAYTATVDVFTDGVVDTPHLVDLTGYVDVTKVVIYNITNGGGLAWDDFRFNTERPTPVETAGWGQLKSIFR